jgi:CRP-like cAMP-binding protein
MTQYSGNRLLDVLSSTSRDKLLTRSKLVALPLKMDLYNPYEKPPYAYFLTSGLASVVAAMEEGEMADVQLSGPEGVVGALHLVGPASVSTHAFMQIAGTAVRIPYSDMEAAFCSPGEIQQRILELIQVESVTLAQIAGCNRLHPAEKRLALWILTAQDRTQSEVLKLTQELLGTTVGCRRSTITMLAIALQEKCIIRYSRGQLRIVDRVRLEAAACSCYEVTRQLQAKLYGKPIHGRAQLVVMNGFPLRPLDGESTVN